MHNPLFVLYCIQFTTKQQWCSNPEFFWFINQHHSHKSNIHDFNPQISAEKQCTFQNTFRFLCNCFHFTFQQLSPEVKIIYWLHNFGEEPEQLTQYLIYTAAPGGWTNYIISHWTKSDSDSHQPHLSPIPNENYQLWCFGETHPSIVEKITF